MWGAYQVRIWVWAGIFRNRGEAASEYEGKCLHTCAAWLNAAGCKRWGGFKGDKEKGKASSDCADCQG